MIYRALHAETRVNPICFLLNSTSKNDLVSWDVKYMQLYLKTKCLRPKGFNRSGLMDNPFLLIAKELLENATNSSCFYDFGWCYKMCYICTAAATAAVTATVCPCCVSYLQLIEERPCNMRGCGPEQIISNVLVFSSLLQGLGKWGDHSSA